MYHAATEEHHCACLDDRMDDRFRRKFGNYAGVDAHEHPFFTVHRVDFVTMGATQKREWTLIHFTVIQVDAYRYWAVICVWPGWNVLVPLESGISLMRLEVYFRMMKF